MNTTIVVKSYRAQKGGFMKDAASEGIALVFPDTSPRGAGIEGEDEDWDFGTGKSQFPLQILVKYLMFPRVGAGFYLNATNPKYSRHYNMLTHVMTELPQILETAGLPIVPPLLSLFFRSLLTITLPGLQTSVHLRSLNGWPWCSNNLSRVSVQHKAIPLGLCFFPNM